MSIEADVLPAAQRYGMGVLSCGPAERRLAVGSGRARRRGHAGRRRRRRSFDLSIAGNQAKLDAGRGS